MAVDPHQKQSEPSASIILPTWLEQYRWPIVGVVAIVVVIIGAMNWVRSGEERAKVDSMQQLMSAQTPNDLMAVSAEYPDSAAAPLAMMKLAKSQYDEGKFEEAMKNYEAFSSQYPTHELAEGALLGRLHCLEAMGRIEDALKGFEDFQKEMHFLNPQAVIAQARCLRAMNKVDDARVVYEDFIAANPKSSWTPRFKELLDEVTKKDQPPVVTGVAGDVQSTGSKAAGRMEEPTKTGGTDKTKTVESTADKSAPAGK